jgi:hypothetical protein
MGKGSSSSSSSSTTSTNTQNLALEDVDGVTVAGSEQVTVNMTDGGAFDVLGHMLDVYQESQVKALDTVADQSLKSMERVNESNRSDTVEMLNKATVIVGIGGAAWVASKIWGKK